MFANSLSPGIGPLGTENSLMLSLASGATTKPE